MELTILGYKGGYPSNGVGTSAYLLESDGYHLLIDVGSGSLLALEEHLNPLSLDAVLLSHYHYDHVTDVGSLQQTRKLKKSAAFPKGPPVLPIYAHSQDSIFSLLTKENVTKAIAYETKSSFSIGPFELTHMKTRHPVICYAFRIVERKTGKVLVYTADSGYMKELIDFSQGADLLLADTSFYKGQENNPVHMTSIEVARIAKNANVLRTILTHLPEETHDNDLELLRKQALEEAPNSDFMLAKKGEKIKI